MSVPDKNQEAWEGITKLIARAIQDAVIMKDSGVVTHELIKGLAQNAASQIVQNVKEWA